MEGWQKDILRRHRVAILDDLYVDYVVDNLIAKDVLQPEHMDRINDQATRKDKARLLLDLLPTLGPKAYPEFIDSLHEPYPWLYEKLSSESKNTSTNIDDVISASISNSEVNKHNTSQMLLQDMCHLLSTLSSVSSACGTSLCAIGDSLAVLVQTVKVVESLPGKVSRKNSINKSLDTQNSNLNFENDAEDQTTKENKRVDVDVNQEKINACKGNISFVNARGEEWSEKILDEVYKKEQDNVNSVFAAESHERLMLNGLTDSSPVGGMPINSPDSGIIAEDMEHLKITCSNEKKTFDNNVAVTSEIVNDELDGCLNNFSANSPGDTNISYDVLHMKMKPLIADVERLQHSILDISVALKSVVTVSDRTLRLANSVSN